MQKETVIGVPQGLLWHRYGILWQVFLEKLGFTVITSPKTNKFIFDLGELNSTDEVCLASKIYLGHAASLVGKCDALFVPCYDSSNVRSGFCTKCQALPDLVRATFRDKHERVLTFRILDARNTRKTKKAFVDFATSELGATAKSALSAWDAAYKAQSASDRKRALHQEESFCLLDKIKRMAEKGEMSASEVPLTILLVAHPYVCHDEYIAGDIVRSIEEMGAFVVYADESDKDACFKKSFEFSDTLPWAINRELAGSILHNRNRIDGIVLLSAFPCGPDSMFDDAVTRYFKDIPILNLMIDSLSGTAGIQTRVESFVDILHYRKKGSYLDGKEKPSNG